MKNIKVLNAIFAVSILAAACRVNAQNTEHFTYNWTLKGLLRVDFNQPPQGSTLFTYQVRLNINGRAVTGSYSLTFAIYEAKESGNLIAGPITNSNVAATNGMFTVGLNFGSSFLNSTNCWLQIVVNPIGSETFKSVAPRERLTSSAYAIALVSSQANALCPTGAVIAYMGTNPPAGWLLCDGSAISRFQYASLFAVLNTASGAGDGTTTFNLPDMRGVFLRGTDNGRGADPDTASRVAISNGGNTGDAVGSFQPDEFRSHSHSLENAPGISFYQGSGGVGFQQGVLYNGPNEAPSIGATGGNETRPVNVNVNHIIKY